MTLEIFTTSAPDQIVVPASRYTFAELAEIYNNSRVDYIVPMPMNARRMEEYVHNYDIDLSASAVSLLSDGEPTGVGMLGLRDTRSWITRLGVVPVNRGRKTGQLLMDTLLDNSRSRGATLVQLEVIKGNDPARRLFEKLGFVHQRELLIIRRPPGIPKSNPELAPAAITALDSGEIALLLAESSYAPSWVEEARSILRAGSLKGFRVELANGSRGWVVFQMKSFQISHLVFAVQPTNDPAVTRALLHHLHTQFSGQDTKIENMPADDLCWPVFQEMGYVEAFRRHEMTLKL